MSNSRDPIVPILARWARNVAVPVLAVLIYLIVVGWGFTFFRPQGPLIY